MTIDTVFSRFPTLSTDRMDLRSIRSTDAEAFLVIKSDLEVTRHYGQEPHQSLDDTPAWVERMQNSFGQRDALFWCLALKGQDTPIGACTLWNFDADFYYGELGYELNPAYHQRGLMAEALPAVLNYGFKRTWIASD